MAWLANCSSNDELWDELLQFGVVNKSHVDAFKSVDRGKFVPDEIKHSAYNDCPLRSGCYHLSAPHIYAMALESLQLIPHVSVLNVGCGSGYFQCVIAAKLGIGSVIHGIEIIQELVDQSRTVCNEWLVNWLIKNHGRLFSHSTPINFKIVAGNCFLMKLKDKHQYDRY